MESKNDYNDWFEQEFGITGTTEAERSAVMAYGPELVYMQNSNKGTGPLSENSNKGTGPLSEFSEGFRTLMSAKATTHAGYVRLVDRLKVLNNAYYQKGEPMVTDDEWEQLKYQCMMVEELHREWTLPDSPTRTIGDDSLLGLPKVGHRTPMLSLKKVDGRTDADKREKLRRWFERTADCKPVSIEWKYDGNSVSLVYQDGQLVEASTRGKDGKEGSMITAQLTGLTTIPEHIDAQGRVEVRGELIIPDAQYEALWSWDKAKTQQAQIRKVLEQFSRPELAREQGLEFRPFEVISNRGTGPLSENSNRGTGPLSEKSLSHTARMQWAIAQGFAPVTMRTATSYDDLLHVIEDMENQRDTLGLPTDGIVIKLDDDRDREVFGETCHHPNWAVAWKYAARRIAVTITGVGTTKTGKPCLYFDRITIDGMTFDHVDVKAADMVDYPFSEGEQIVISLKPGSSSIQFEENSNRGPVPLSENSNTGTGPLSENLDRGTGTVYEFPDYEDEEMAYNEWLENHSELLGTVQNETEIIYESFRPAPTHSDPFRPVSDPFRPVPTHSDPCYNDDAESADDGQGTRHPLLHAAGFIAAASIALVLIWQTGLLIPLALLGMAVGAAK